MERAESGYTILEVMLVLAISGVLFISAVALFRGKQGETQFSQAMHDIDSKIQSYVNDVGVSVFPDAQKYTCKTNSGKPYLTNSASAIGSNQDCLFLGKAIQVTPGSKTLYAYTVLGNRTTTDPLSGDTVSATTFDQTNPEPAVDGAGNFIPELIEDYDITLDAAKVTSAHITTSADPPPACSGEADLAGFYNSLQTASQSGSQSLLARAYCPFTSSASSPQNGVRNCIEQQAGCNHFDFKDWTICFTGTGTSQTAELVITATPAGVNTKLNFVGCT